MVKYIYSIMLLLLVMIFFASCVKESFTDNPKHRVEFSLDTICFDTLFSETASYTRTFLVRNENKEDIKFSSIRLGGGANSSFRFNVDGYLPNDENAVYDIEVRGKDSIYVFVETTVPEDSDTVDLLVMDSLMFMYNSNVSQVQLQAVGKNAVLLRNHTISQNETLSGDKPYLIMGYLSVPFGNTLKIEAGAELYFHAGANLIVDGDIEVRGTLEKPVLMRGNRFDNINDADDTPYENLPSQWGSIYLQNSSGKHVFEYTHIRGASLGILLVGTSRTMPELMMSNCVLHSFGGYGIYSQNGNVTIENTEISNCGISCLYVVGGELSMQHSTLANYYNFGARQTPACYITNYAKQSFNTIYYPVASAVIENSIIFGGNATEIVLDNDTISNTEYNVLLSYNLLKSKEMMRTEFQNNYWAYSQNKMGEDTVFVSTTNNEERGYFNFRLDTLSHALSRANRDVAERYPLDLSGGSRLADGAPDLGAYERK